MNRLPFSTSPIVCVRSPVPRWVGLAAQAWFAVWLVSRALGVGVYFGDIDGDGAVTVVDLVRLTRHLDKTELLTAANLLPADANRDGKVDDADIEALRETILGKRAQTLLPDTDGDGLPDGYESLIGLAPAKADTDGNGVKDGDEDLDGDGLSNRREMLLGTDPRKTDTDGDGWSDEAEVAAGSQPLDGDDTPRFLVATRPSVRVLAPGFDGAGARLGGTFVAMPRTTVLIPGLETGGVAAGTWLARPIVRALTPAGPGSDPQFGGTYLARPPLKMLVTSSSPGESAVGTFLSKPPVRVKLAGQ